MVSLPERDGGGGGDVDAAVRMAESVAREVVTGILTDLNAPSAPVKGLQYLLTLLSVSVRLKALVMVRVEQGAALWSAEEIQDAVAAKEELYAEQYRAI